MADTAVAITAGAGTNIDTRTEATNGNHRQVVVIGDPSVNAGVAPVDVTLGLSVKTPPGNATIAKAESDGFASADVGAPMMYNRRITPITSSDLNGDYEMLQGHQGAAWTISPFLTSSVDVTRPADTNVYAANDAISDSTTAPLAGGFTFTGPVRKTGGSGIITDLIVASSNPAGGLSAELWIFDSAVPNVNDNAAFAISDAEIKTVVAKIPFATTADTNNSLAHVQNLNIGFTTVGSANLRFLLKAKGAYTPISAEVFTFRLKVLGVD